MSLVGSRGHRGRRLVTIALSAVLLSGVLSFGRALDSSVLAATVPEGFVETTVWSGLTNPTSIEFSSDGRVFVAEKRGIIKVFDGLDDPTATIFADLRTNVYNFWDRGLLGMALAPGFPADPYVYVLYTYDAMPGGVAPRWGTAGASDDPCPSPPGATTDGCVVTGRLSRLEAAGNAMTGAEQPLITDWCQQYPSHSVGSLAFGPDGALYVSGGDGASFTFADYGQRGDPVNPCGDPPGAPGTALTPPTAQGGALRSQDLRTTTDPTSLDGAILRVVPSTGVGAAGNPHAASSDLNARRIIADGLRNPFRIAFRPGTDELWVGDVGWNTHEEINLISDVNDGTHRNFGWPCYEGVSRQAGYDALNLSICETLYNTSGAVRSPMFSYPHASQVVAGESCQPGGSSISGFAFYEGGAYPAAYDGAAFFSDYSRKCIWAMLPDANGVPDPDTIQTFVAAAHDPVDLAIGPGGDLFFVDFAGAVRRISYVAQEETGIFADDFESGDMSEWTTVNAVTAQSGIVYGGAFAARGVANSGQAFATRTIGSALDDASYRVRFRVTSQGSGGYVYLARIMTAGNKYVAGLYRHSNGRLGLRNDITKTSTTSTTQVSLGAWHEIRLRFVIDGTSSTTEVWFDGVLVGALGGTRDLGTTSIGRIQIGDNNNGRTFDIAWDDVLVESGSVGGGNQPPSAVIDASPTSGAAPLTVDFDASGSTDPDPGDALSFAWDLDDDGTYDDSTAVSVQHTFIEAGIADVGLRVTDQGGAVDTASVSINVGNTAPVATINTPTALTTWAVGDTISFSGGATDDQDGTLPASALDWDIIVQHCPSTCHAHVLTSFAGVASGQFVAPDHDYPSSLEIRLRATDSSGSTHTATRTIEPKTTTIQLVSEPAGLVIGLDSEAVAAPFTRTVIQGSHHSVSAPSPQGLGGTTYSFGSWSDGGSAVHDVEVGSTPLVLTATYDEEAAPDGIFVDDFETGDLSQWTTSAGMAVQSGTVFGGTYAARANTTGDKAWASRTLAQPLDEIWYRIRFRVASQGTGSIVYLARVISPANKYIAGLYRASNGRLGLRNDTLALSTTSTQFITLGEWHELKVRVRINGSSSESEVWYDGARMDTLSLTTNLGTANVGRVQIGDNNGGRTYDITWDDVLLDSESIP